MIRKTRPARRMVAAGIVMALVSGCGWGKESFALVRGKIFYQGMPVRMGTVVFAPDVLRGTTGPLAQAEIQPDGSYVLETKGVPGAVPGWHRVTILSLESSPTIGPDGDFVQPRSLVPEKYGDPELSGLSREVRGGQENCIDFELE
jgi:hypothetical protein